MAACQSWAWTTSGTKQGPRQFEGAAAEQGKAPGVVGIVVAPFAVEPVAVEQFRHVEEVNRDPVDSAAPDTDLGGRAAQGHCQRFRLGPQVAGDVAHAAIPGEHQAHIDAARAQRRRQRAEHIAEPPALGKGRGFGSDHEDA